MNDYKELFNSTILITGATGMIGKNIVELLEYINQTDNGNIRIIVHGRDKQKIDSLYPDYKKIVCDISELHYNGDVDYIIHTASITGGSKQHMDYPLRTLNTSIDGTRRVLELGKEKNSKGVVFLSSIEVYGYTESDKPSIKECDGGFIDTMNPRSSYKEGKRISECLFTAYAKEYNLRAMVARLTSSFGYGVAYHDNRVFAQFARSILNRENIVLKSTGETVRNYCDAKDVASALLILLCKGEKAEAYNVANMNTEISIKALAQKFIDNYPEAGSELIFDLGEDAVNLGYNPIIRCVLDSSKLMKLGWTPKYDIDNMIVHLVEYMKTLKQN